MAQQGTARHQTLLGFDFGEKKIGVASGQAVTRSASALTTLTSRNGKPDWPAIKKLINEWQPDALVVGIPYHMDGSKQKMTTAAESFCRQLEGRFSLIVYRADERLSSYQAEQYLASQDNHCKNTIDAVAAQIILQSWLQQEALDT